MDGAEERLEVGDLNGNKTRTAPIRIGQDADQQLSAMHLRANALLDACDAPGQGMYASPTDPHQFFLHDEDDDAPVMTIEQGRGLILGGDGRDAGSGGRAGHAGHAAQHDIVSAGVLYLCVKMQIDDAPGCFGNFVPRGYQ